ncbi:AraC family transcriptional regulator [Planococcus citreus]|uniref:AraC-like DNA-binding protein n=1 Tax=Planococcus citreus TaxID=1373 RepID=A0A497YR90_9BACL|nr:AraC family transcriptional regulator [Planococcus citreus]RLJ87001.1 AraC-like DNA-binding protein [Planococcus citreus]
MSGFQDEFTKLIERHIDGDGKQETEIPSLFFTRFSQVTGPHYGVQSPSLCIIAQGSKEIILAHENFIYGPSEYLLTSVNLPITGQVIEGTPDAPYLAIKLEFTSNEILAVLHASQLKVNRKEKAKRGMSVTPLDGPLLDAVIRLARLLDQPNDILALAPLIKQEILYRLLQGPHGATLKQMALEESSTYQISDAIQYIMKNFHQPFRIEDLAEIANLSVSSFHRQFKQVTAMSPVQFQKQLRLQEARRLLVTEATEATDVAFRIGYESPSQFSREYSRMFGFPPKEDLKRIRSEV